ncbi:hypothetical protein [Modestobacter sp. SYSU DS0875]
MFCRSSGSTASPVSQAGPVRHSSCIPDKIRTAALVSGVEFAVTLVVYESTKAASVPVPPPGVAATGAASAAAGRNSAAGASSRAEPAAPTLRKFRLLTP